MFRQSIKGLTLKTDAVGNITATIHEEDFLEALKEIPLNGNGCKIVVAEKRPTVSEKGHTHYQPCFVTTPKPR